MSNDGTNQWHQRGMAIILEKTFSLKMRFSKVMASFKYSECQRPYCVFTSTVASPYAKEDNGSSVLLEVAVNK